MSRTDAKPSNFKTRITYVLFILTLGLVELTWLCAVAYLIFKIWGWLR